MSEVSLFFLHRLPLVNDWFEFWRWLIPMISVRWQSMFENRARMKTDFNLCDFHSPSMLDIAFVCIRQQQQFQSVSSLRLGPSKSWIRSSPRSSIFAHPKTQQTIIVARTAGSSLHPAGQPCCPSSLSFCLVYVLPPMANRRKKLFSVAGLLARGYASLTNRRSDDLSTDNNVDRYFRCSNRQCNIRSKFLHHVLWCIHFPILEMRWSKFYAKTRRFSDSIRTEYKSHFDSKCQSEESEDKESEKESEEENYYNYGKPYRRVRTHQSNASIRFLTSVMLAFDKECVSRELATYLYRSSGFLALLGSSIDGSSWSFFLFSSSENNPLLNCPRGSG